MVILLFMIPYLTLAQTPEQSIKLDFTDAPISKVIASIEKQSKYKFFYNNDIDIKQRTSIKIISNDLNKVVGSMLKNTSIDYRISDQRIVLFVKKDPADKGKSYTVSGVVNDANGPVIGATVATQDGHGSITALDGDFRLENIHKGDVLIISYVGYKTKRIAFDEKSKLNITLEENATELDQVVVTALGIKRSEKALSYNVQTVKQDDFTTIKSTNIMNSLNGKVAGLSISSSSSGLGGATRVVMRGSKSIDQSSNALYVIDGIPMNNTGGGGSTEFSSSGATEGIADINPEDVESVSVLTGAAAAALYGNQGANGAIVINTKKGAVGKLEVNVTSSSEFLSPFVTPEFQNRYGTGDSGLSGGSAVKSWGAQLAPENRYSYDPTDDFLRTGTTFTNSVSISTGNEKNQTYFSASAVNGDGIVPNNEYDRYNFTFRNTASFLNNKMRLDIGANYIIQKDQNMRNQGVYSNPVSSAYLFPRGNDFELARIFERYDAERGINVQFWDEFVGSGDYDLQNPYWAAYRNLANNDKKRYMFNAGLSYDILDWLNIGGRVRIDNSTTEHDEKYYASTISTLANANGKTTMSTSQNTQTYADVLMNINKNFKDFGLVVNIGASINDIQSKGISIWGQIRNDGIPNVFLPQQFDKDQRGESTSGSHKQSQALFGSAEISYRSTYYLTVTGRNDWESALANTDQLSFFYPSVGLSTILSQALDLPKQIDYLKIRASFSQVGNAIPLHISIPTYPWADGGWSNKSIYPIYHFEPELTTSWEVGLTARVFKHFNLDLTWYYAQSKNQTFQPGISPSAGYSSMYVQTGNVRNTGFEVAMGYSNSWKKDWKWSSNLAFNFNDNKIKELMNNYQLDGNTYNMDEFERGGLDRAKFILRPGGSLGDLYSYVDLLHDNKGHIYTDESGKPQAKTLDGNERILLGSVSPKCNLSWRNDISWKNLSLGFMLSARFGGIVYSQTQSALDYYGVSEVTAAARDRGGVMVNQNLINAEDWYTTIAMKGNAIPQYYTYSATNIRLQELSLGYTIPRKWLKDVASVSLSLIGHNLWMLYCKAPFDPETTASTTNNYYQGIDYFMMPSLRNIGFSLKVRF